MGDKSYAFCVINSKTVQASVCCGDEYWRVGFVEEGLCARRAWSGEGGLLRTEKGKQEIKTEKGYLCAHSHA